MIGYEAATIDTSVTVEIGTGNDGHPAILGVSVVCSARVPGILEERFEYCAERARVHCTIAKLMNIEIGLEASLLQ